MKRVTKNIIHFTIVALMLVLILYPLLLDKPPDMQNQAPGQQQMQSPPGSSGGQEPPAKPDGDNNQNMNNGQEPPAKPDGQEPPAKPDGQEPPGMQNGQNSNNMGGNSPTMGGQQKPSDNGGAIIFDLCICLIEFLILNIFLIYLIMSKANKYSFAQTFSTGKRKLIYGISVVIITIAGVAILNIPFGGSSEPPKQMDGQGMSQNQQSNINYNAEKTINTDTSEDNGQYSSSIENKLAVLVTDKITANLNKFNLIKTGSSNEQGDNTSFYGTNSGILAKDGASLKISDSTINTDANGANAVFSFGGSMTNNSGNNDGTNVRVENCTINTKQDDSGGVMVTGGGIMNVINCIIETLGRSSAALRTDRGGGSLNVEGGTYTTSGPGSPAIYSTADVSVNNANLNSNNSEGVVIEGKNTVSLTNCKLNDSNTMLNGQSTTYKNIFLYQSMSGDSEEGTSEFGAKDSEIITNNGDSFYVTNTKAIINLENNSIVNNDNSGNFLRIQKDSWGKEGSNGGDVLLNMKKQSATGNIVFDSISKLEMHLTNNSYWEGNINGDDISLKLDSSSKIKLTGDCHIKSLSDESSDYSNIDFNGYKLYVNGEAI